MKELSETKKELEPEYYGRIKIRILKYKAKGEYIDLASGKMYQGMKGNQHLYNYKFEYDNIPVSRWLDVFARSKREVVAHAIKHYETTIKHSFIITEYGTVKKLW